MNFPGSALLARLRTPAAPKFDVGQTLSTAIRQKNIGGIEHLLLNNLDSDERSDLNDGTYALHASSALNKLLREEGPTPAFWGVCDTLHQTMPNSSAVFKRTVIETLTALPLEQSAQLLSGMAQNYLANTEMSFWTDLGKNLLRGKEVRSDGSRCTDLLTLADAVEAVRPSAGEALRAAPGHLLDELVHAPLSLQRGMSLILDTAPHARLMEQVQPAHVMAVALLAGSRLTEGRTTTERLGDVARLMQALEPYPTLTQRVMAQPLLQGLTYVPALTLSGGQVEPAAFIDPDFPVMIVHASHRRRTLPEYLNEVAHDAMTSGRADAVLPAVFGALAQAAVTLPRPEQCRVLQAEVKALGTYYADLWRDEVGEAADKRIAQSLKTVGVVLPLSPL